MKIAIHTVLTFFTISIFFSCTSVPTKDFSSEEITIIPKPKEITLNKGSFLINAETRIFVSDDSQESAASIFTKKFNTASGFDLKISKGEHSTSTNSIVFISNSELKKEAYSLNIADSKITIEANSYGGFIYGIQSLFQLLPVEIEGSSASKVDWLVPNIVINDAPRFGWRGLMLDLSRHFFDKEYVKEVIDGLALHKMNVLHLHLVDDQGWRIEIKKYPKLTEFGAWRVDQEDAAWNGRRKTSPDEKGTYGGFLSQEDLKEIVAYGQRLNVEIVPEIEMPAHVSSAVASYPYLSCFDKSIGVPSGGLWPITDIYCAGKESTFEFLEDVLLEVMEIFPSKYIHIGGDEATKTNWEKCSYCQKRIQTEKLENVKELQSYFVKRMEKFINSHGKKLIGWDEILEGGLAPDATVMSWRGVKGGVEATEQGHDVVMTPGSHCYFDHYQGPQNEEPLAWGGFTPLSKVYQFDPIVESMTDEQAAHVLGGQANLWSEFVPTNAHSEYMIYPRIAAMSEAVWSPKELRDWDDFSVRIQEMFKRYDVIGYNYAKSAYLVTSKTEINLETKTILLALNNEFPNSDIRFVLGEGDVDKTATRYTNPINLLETTIVKASIFKNDEPVGKIFIDTLKFHKAIAKQVNYQTNYSDRYKGQGVFNLVNGLRGSKNFHDGQWQGWIRNDMEIVIDLGTEQAINSISVGTLENQGSGIYFPSQIEVYTSSDGKSYKKQGAIKRAYQLNGNSDLKDFRIRFDTVKVKYVKVKVAPLKKVPNGGGAWLFIDEVLVE